MPKWVDDMDKAMDEHPEWFNDLPWDGFEPSTRAKEIIETVRHYGVDSPSLPYAIQRHLDAYNKENTP